jgi:prepilin-type N-terminal cleavage/methylation domain-containing protein
MLGRVRAFRGERNVMRNRRRQRRAFTLVEMVMVVMIIGMISSMAIPRITRGSTAASDAALAADLTIVRKAILFYAAEHNGEFPGPSAGRFSAHLTQFSNASGQSSVSRSAAYPLGPYLNSIPRCPVGPNAGNTGVLVDAANSPPQADVTTGDGWLYNPNTGEFYANVPGIAQHGTIIVGKVGGAQQALEVD